MEPTIKTYEDALLGFIILKPDPRMLEVREILPTSDYFTDPVAKGIYRAFIEFMDKDQFPSDAALTVMELYKYMEANRKCGFHFDDMDSLARHVSYLIKDFTFFDPENYKEYAKQIRWEYDKKALKEQAQHILASADNVTYGERDDYISEVESKLGNLTLSIRDNKGLLPISEASKASWERIELLHDHKSVNTGIKTGIHSLDQKLGGLNPGEIIVLAANTGAGKTALSLAIAENVAMYEKKSVMIFSLEMMDQQLTDRMLTRLAHVSMDRFSKDYQRILSGEHIPQKERDIITGRLEGQYWRLKKAYEGLNSLPIYQTTSGALTTNAIKSMILQKKRELGNKGENDESRELGLVIIDYLQIIQPPEGMKSANRTDVVGDMSRKCKQIAKEAQVPILLLAQLNRNAEQDAAPELRDLRESGSIEQDADRVLFLYGPNAKKEPESYAYLGDPIKQDLACKRDKMHVIIKVAKNRQGESGSVNAIFDWDYQSFISQSNDHVQRESFDEFLAKYYQQTRSGNDLFFPYSDTDIMTGMNQYRHSEYVEAAYLDANDNVVFPNSASAFKPAPSVANNPIVASKPVAEPVIIDDLATDFGEIDDEPEDHTDEMALEDEQTANSFVDDDEELDLSTFDDFNPIAQLDAIQNSL